MSVYVICKVNGYYFKPRQLFKKHSVSYKLAGAHNGGIYQVANVKYNHVKIRNTRYFGTLGITSQMTRSN